MDSDSRVYIESVTRRLETPERSRLFAMDAIGVGTAVSEGLISYIVRLADAHSISPRLLIKSVYLPLMSNPKAVAHTEFFSDLARTLHSTGIFSKKFVEMTESLTSKSDLALLTALPWRNIIPTVGTGFMALHPKWCRSCLAEHTIKGTESYFRLSWGFQLYEVCSFHREVLLDECPWCGKHQPFFPYAPDLSRCAECFGWLGTQDGIPSEGAISDEQLWISAAIENMIVHSEGALELSTGSVFRARLTHLVDTYGNS